MTMVKDIYNFIDEIAPFRTQDSWDNSGLLVGRSEEKVTRVLLSLDATIGAVDQAHDSGCELIITHHPVIFHGLMSLDDSLPAARLLKYDIACISAHTNLDSAEYSISDMMVDTLGLKNSHQLIDVNRRDTVTGRAVGYGATAECEDELTPYELARLCKERFNCVAIKYVAGKRKIRRVGMVSGAGSECLYQAHKMGLDAFVTAEVKHHEFLDAQRLGLTLIDAGHHETEAIAMPYLKKLLEEKFSDVSFELARSGFAASTVL